MIDVISILTLFMQNEHNQLFCEYLFEINVKANNHISILV